jgi:hypothetical protein
MTVEKYTSKYVLYTYKYTVTMTDETGDASVNEMDTYNACILHGVSKHCTVLWYRTQITGAVCRQKLCSMFVYYST